ncbi:paraquat-inducible protein A [Luteibacter sp. UNCMF366Tsu5.1]|uniref:paraquat-inducible protein A n=1 Tax=Luteibacter sp. UNCMF366Tsu5.1 TaxID=1502758 RepID=UPI000908C791|nr:paraquat-inducible protein A [Luteibacter sp. UNCMF366Tsu5.1]SFW57323.1 paraquat-inducible protein A [Luteibacter sp. UNCMF366Tsu5.1]
MKTFPHLIACEHCDTIYARPALAIGESARCDRCHSTLCRADRLDLDQWLALTVAAAIVAVIANVCPVVRISLQGLHNEATLWQATVALAQGAVALIAVPAMLAVIVVPFAQILLLFWVLAFARAGRRAPWFVANMRLLVALRPWSMIEVALLGILISVIKLSGFLHVAPGAGIWAMATLMVLLTVIARRDLDSLWAIPERGKPA